MSEPARGRPKEEMAGTGSGMSSRGISFASGDGKPGWVRNQLQNIFQPTDNKVGLFRGKILLLVQRKFISCWCTANVHTAVLHFSVT